MVYPKKRQVTWDDKSIKKSKHGNDSDDSDEEGRNNSPGQHKIHTIGDAIAAQQRETKRRWAKQQKEYDRKRNYEISLIPAGRYGLFIEGKVICLSDYGADLADALSTRVILIQDKDHSNTIPVHSIIDPKKAYRESRVLTNNGAGRFSAYYANPICISPQIKKILHDYLELGKSELVVPIMYRNSKFEKETIIDTNEFGRLFFDLRNARMKQIEIIRRNCFKEDLGMWNKKNVIVGPVEMPKGKYKQDCNSVVYSLAKQRRILHIVCGRVDPDELVGFLVDFTFYDSTTLEEKVSYSIKTFAQTRAMIMNSLDTSKKEAGSRFEVAMNDD